MQVITKEIIMSAVEGQEVAVFNPATGGMVPCYFQLMNFLTRGEWKIFLTTKDSRPDEYNQMARNGGEGRLYRHYIKHVRLHTNAAVMTREEMCDVIETRQYTIG